MGKRNSPCRGKAGATEGIAGAGGWIVGSTCPAGEVQGGSSVVTVVLKEAKAVGHTAVLQEGVVSGCRAIKALAVIDSFLF